MMTLTHNWGRTVHYNTEEIKDIVYESYKQLEKTGEYDLSDYKKSEVFMNIRFKNGDESHFPTSTWSIQF